jgi:hypothetical protein
MRTSDLVVLDLRQFERHQPQRVVPAPPGFSALAALVLEIEIAQPAQRNRRLLPRAFDEHHVVVELRKHGGDRAACGVEHEDAREGGRPAEGWLDETPN